MLGDDPARVPDVDGIWQLPESGKYENTCGLTVDLHGILNIQDFSLDGFERLFKEKEFIDRVQKLKSQIKRESHVLPENQKCYLYFCYFLSSKAQFAFFVDHLKSIFISNDEDLCYYILGNIYPYLIVRLLSERSHKPCDKVWLYLKKNGICL